MAGLHEEARGCPSCQDGMLEGFRSEPRGRACVARGHVSWVFPRYAGRCHFSFHLIRKCNTSSKTIFTQLVRDVKTQPWKDLSASFPQKYALLGCSCFLWNLWFSHRSLWSVCFLIFFLYLKGKSKYIVRACWDDFPWGIWRKQYHSAKSQKETEPIGWSNRLVLPELRRTMTMSWPEKVKSCFQEKHLCQEAWTFSPVHSFRNQT